MTDDAEHKVAQVNIDDCTKASAMATAILTLMHPVSPELQIQILQKALITVLAAHVDQRSWYKAIMILRDDLYSIGPGIAQTCDQARAQIHKESLS